MKIFVDFKFIKFIYVYVQKYVVAKSENNIQRTIMKMWHEFEKK